MEISDMDATTITALTTVAGTLSAAVGGVYKRLAGKLDECEKKHIECEQRAAANQKEVGEIKHRLGDLEGYLRATMEYRSASDQSGSNPQIDRPSQAD